MKKFIDPISESEVIITSKLRKRGKPFSQFQDETLGKIGTPKRDEFEFEMRMEIIQELIKDIRKKRNLSQQELGDKIGVNKAQISKLEKGYSNTTIALLSRVFTALNAKLKISVELEDEKLELV